MTSFQIHLTQPALTVAPIKGGRRIPVPIRVVELPANEADLPRVSSEELRQRAELLQAEQQIAETVRRISNSLDPLWQRIESKTDELKTVAVQLALMATRAIANADFQDGSARMLHLIESALARFPSGHKIQIRVHPDLLERIRSLLAADQKRDPLVILADRAIKPGEVQLDHALFSLASDLNHHLNEIERAMLEAINDVVH